MWDQHRSYKVLIKMRDQSRDRLFASPFHLSFHSFPRNSLNLSIPFSDKEQLLQATQIQQNLLNWKSQWPVNLLCQRKFVCTKNCFTLGLSFQMSLGSTGDSKARVIKTLRSTAGILSIGTQWNIVIKLYYSRHWSFRHE